MRFSVIIPLYNKASYVAKAILSVLSQSISDFELVIMDDGSKDDSYEVALKTIEGHHNCHLYRQKNGGVSVARNNAVALSQGEYLCFLDADDCLSLNALAEIAHTAKDADVVRFLSAPLHFGGDEVVFHVNAQHSAFACVCGTAWQPVTVVNTGESVQPLLPPPCHTEFLGHSP